MIRERLDMAKSDVMQRCSGEREEPLGVGAIGSLRGGRPAVQPQLQEASIAVRLPGNDSITCGGDGGVQGLLECNRTALILHNV